MRYCFAFVLFIILSCAKSPTAEKPANDTTYTPPVAHIEPKVDSLANATYVGVFNFFEETNEFYVSLYHRDGKEQVNASDIVDSIVYQDGDDYVRKSIPIETAREYFMLEG